MPRPSPPCVPTVLVVDDEPFVVRAIQRALQAAGYRVLPASDARSALALLDHQEVATLVTDVGIPGLDGTELLREVRRRDPDLPVLLVTGDPRTETAVRALELGANGYLLKPIDAAALRAAVARAVDAYEAARARRVQGHGRALEALEECDRRLSAAMAELYLAFQPIVQWPERTVFAHEALLRTREPSFGGPAQIFEVAARLGRLRELGRRVRALAASAVPALPERDDLFVNLHTQELLDDELYDPGTPLAAHAPRIVLELTERGSLHEVPEIARRIATLRTMGFRIAIDDLGAGYAGLSSFVAVEPDVVKLDVSLVRDVDRNPRQRRLVASMLEVCRALGVAMVVEGVETTAERDALASLGCTRMQGYLFGRPRPEIGPEIRTVVSDE